jgi:hypothetical protein
MRLRTIPPRTTFAALALLGAIDATRAQGDYDARPMGEAPLGATPGIVRVHADYDWIRKGGYKGVDGTSCCGKDDCDQIPTVRVERTPQGYRLPDYGLFVPFRQSRTSEDGKYWLCRDEKAMRCFFAPPPGS